MTTGDSWLLVVVVLTMNSAPFGVPFALKICARKAEPLVSPLVP